MTSPQKAAWMLRRLMPEMVTTNVTSEPRVKLVANAVTKACWRARSIAMPPRARTNSLGAASISRVSVGANAANTRASRPYATAAVYWRSLFPDDVNRALVGPVTQAETAPKPAFSSEKAPDAMAKAFTGGRWPAARRTAMPWPFWTNSTVRARGTTSSSWEAHVNAGAVKTGVARSGPPGGKLNCPLAATARQPATRVPRTGGRYLPSLGTAVRTRNAATIGAATAGLSWVDATMSVPNFRNTAATMAITSGIGTNAMALRTTPVAPSARISTPEVKRAPTTSGKARCCRDGPRSTVPGMDQAKPRGCR